MKISLKAILSATILMIFIVTSLGFITIPVESIKLNSTIVNLQAGETFALKVTIKPVNATNKILTFSTANKNVATVDKNGRIKGVRPGKTVITVTSVSNKKLMARCNVTISQVGNYFPLRNSIKVKIAAARPDTYETYEKMEIFKEFEKNTNIQVKWIDWSASVIKERKSLAFATNELPDAFIGGWCIDQSNAVTYGSQGFLLVFNKYINDYYMPNFNRLVKKDIDVKLQNTTPDGNVYVLPSFFINSGQQVLTHDTTIINSTWLKKVGKEIPKTTTELVDVLRAFKAAGDLNGNGKADEIPMSLRYNDNINGQRSIVGWFGQSLGTNNTPEWDKNGKLVFPQITSEYKDAMKFFNQLYKEELLDKEVFTMDNTIYSAKTSQAQLPVVGVYATWNTDIPNNAAKNGDIYEYLPPLKTTNGNTPMWQRRYTPYNYSPSFAINAKSRYTEQLVRWADLFYDTKKGVMNFYGGPVAIQDQGNNTYKQRLGPDGKPYTSDSLSVYSPVNFSLYGILDGEVTIVPADGVKLSTKLTIGNKIYGGYLVKKPPLANYYTSVEEQKKLIIFSSDIMPYVDQMAVKFVTKGEFNQWDEYVKKVNDLGLPQVMSVYNAVAERNKLK